MRAVRIKLGILVLLLSIGVAAAQPDLVPQMVEQVRELVGPQPVAMAEDIFYGALDQYNRWAYQGRTTPGYWDVPPTTQPVNAAPPKDDSGLLASPTPSGLPAIAPLLAQAQSNLSALSSAAARGLQNLPSAANLSGPPPRSGASNSAATAPDTSALAEPTARAGVPPFQPRNVQPLYPALAAPGEGLWLPMPNPYNAAAAPLMFKTFLHPDPARSYARVAIVAVDLTRVQLRVVAGTQEPVSSARVPRSGLIPRANQSTLVAAFNGGFRAIHGRYGMMVAGQMLLPPQPYGDTIALYKDGTVRIAPWTALAATLPQMDSFRQTPPYLAAQGQLNPALLDERSTLWGATVSRDTVIWRSALGLSADRRTLYYGAGESLTARRIAEAMVAAGASDVAELDVNSSYERFLTYGSSSQNGVGALLLPAMYYKPGLYTALPSTRDFFYLTLAPAAQ